MLVITLRHFKIKLQKLLIQEEMLTKKEMCLKIPFTQQVIHLLFYFLNVYNSAIFIR